MSPPSPPSPSSIVLVAALDRDGVIGRGGGLPWHLPRDLAHFKALTLDKPIVMGRKTFESIGRPLPKRRNVVVSRTLSSSEAAIDGIEIVPSVDAALALLRDAPELAVIGGGALFAACLPLADRLELTHVEARVGGDTHFPAIDPSRFELVSEEAHPADERNEHPMRFASYRRRR